MDLKISKKAAPNMLGMLSPYTARVEVYVQSSVNCIGKEISTQELKLVVRKRF